MNKCLNPLVQRGVLSAAVASQVKPEHAPVLVTKWLIPGVAKKGKEPHEPTECLLLRQEFKDLAEPAILTYLKYLPKFKRDIPSQRLLFESKRLAFEYLADLPPHNRTYYLWVPSDKPVSFYLDLDKKLSDEWQGHGNYSWEETLGALRFYVDKTWRKCEAKNKSPPDWTQVLHVFHCNSTGKALSKHLHTTTDKKECALVFSNKGRLRAFFEEMQRVVALDYWDSASPDNGKARILAHSVSKSQFFEQEVTDKDGKSFKRNVEARLEYIFDVQGTGDQWRLPFCCKPEKQPLLPDINLVAHGVTREQIIQAMRIGDPVVPWNPDACHDASLTLKGKKKKAPSIVKEHKQRQSNVSIEDDGFELPDLSERLEQLLREAKALENAYLQRKSDDFYYVLNHRDRFCPLCNRTHDRSNGWIRIDDREDATYGCYRKPKEETFLLGSVKEEITKHESEQAVIALKADADFRKALLSLHWVAALGAQELAEFFDKLEVKFRNNYLYATVHMPKGQVCPACNKAHRAVSLAVGRTKLKAKWVCRYLGKEIASEIGEFSDLPRASPKPKTRKREEISEEPSDVKRLEKKAKVEEKEEKEEKVQAPKQTFEQNDPYTWVDFESDVRRNSPFASKADMQEFILKRINRVYVRIPPGRHVLKRNLSDELFFLYDKNNFTQLKASYTVLYKEGKKIVTRKQTVRLVDVIQNLDLPVYNRIEFQPNPNALDSKCFNIWRGYKAQDLVDEGKKSLEEIVQEPSFIKLRSFFLKNVCNDHEPSFRQLMRILQLMMTRPWEKLEGITVLMAHQGTGKNLFYDFFCDHVLGKGLCHQGTGIKVFTKEFNFHLMGKLLVLADEMASNKDEFHAHWQTMKSVSSSKYLAVNKKFADIISVRNLFYCIFATNNRNAVSIDISDRRFDIITMNNAYANDTDFFKSLLADCFNDHTGNLVFTWLRHTHEFDDVNYRKRVDTAARRECMYLSMPPPLKFLVHVKEQRALDKDSKTQDPARFTKQHYPANILYERFKRWAARNNEKVMNQTSFGSAISDNITKKKSNGLIVYDIDSIQLPDIHEDDLQELPPGADVYEESGMVVS